MSDSCPLSEKRIKGLCSNFQRSCRSGRSAGAQSLREVAADGVEPDPLLRHRVPRADRDRLVLQRVEVDRDAERRADLVLTAVPAADGTRVLEVDVPLL